MIKHSKIHTRRSSEPNTDTGKMISSSRKKSDDITSTEKSASSIIKNNVIYKSMFGNKKKHNEFDPKKLTSSSSENDTPTTEELFKEEENYNSQIHDNNLIHNDLLDNTHERSDELNIKFDLKIISQGNNAITIKTYTISKNNSKQLTVEQFNPIFKTGLGFYVLKQINENKDHNQEIPIHIVYQKHTKQNLNESSFQMIETININNQGVKVITNTNFDLNDLKSNTNGEAVNIKITSPQNSPDINRYTDFNSDDSYIDIDEAMSSLNISNSSILLTGQSSNVVEI